ncbi:hypothetical protein PSYAE_25175, partial [Pseudomonas amygdali pv. aesculi str. 0893_23]
QFLGGARCEFIFIALLFIAMTIKGVSSLGRVQHDERSLF